MDTACGAEETQGDPTKEDCAASDDIANALLKQLDTKDGIETKYAEAETTKAEAKQKKMQAEAVNAVKEQIKEDTKESTKAKRSAEKKAKGPERPTVESVPRIKWDWTIPPRDFIERIAGGRSPVVVYDGPATRYLATRVWDCTYLSKRVPGLHGLRRLDTEFFTYANLKL